MTEKNRGGRPRQHDEAKRSAIAIRTTPETKRRIEDAARANGRSLTQEIEQRLEWSLNFEDQLGGPSRIGLFRLMAWAIGVIEGQHGGRLESDYWAFHRARGAIEGALNTVRPPLPAEVAAELHDVEKEAQAALDRWARTGAALAQRFPHSAPRNALAPDGEWITVPQRRFAKNMSDEELEQAVEGLPPEDEALVRDHQESIRRARIADVTKEILTGELDRRAQEAASAARLQTEAQNRFFRENAAQIERVISERSEHGA